MCCLPPFRQQLVQLRYRHGRQASQHAAEVGLGVDAVTFGGGDEAVERGGSLGGDVMSGEKPILSADADAPQSAFGGVVVDVEEALRGAALAILQRSWPVIPRLRNRNSGFNATGNMVSWSSDGGGFVSAHYGGGCLDSA